MLLELHIEIKGNFGLLKLKGILDISTVDKVIQSFEAFQELQKVNIDFKDVKFIDSTGIGGITQLIKRFNENSIVIKLINISEEVYEVLDLLGLPDIFGQEIFEVAKS